MSFFLEPSSYKSGTELPYGGRKAHYIRQQKISIVMFYLNAAAIDL